MTQVRRAKQDEKDQPFNYLDTRSVAKHLIIPI